MGWDIVPLPEVADYDLGKMLDKIKNRGNLRPYLANLDVRWGEFDLTSLREMRFKDTEIDRYSLQYGDIVMCEGGEPGRCAFWKNEIPEMMFQKALHRIRANDRIEAKFLYYALYDLAYRRQIDGLFTGATIKHLPKGQLAFINVPLPPLHVQRRIAGILSAYDDLIEVNTRRIKALEEMARRTYEEWFVHYRHPGGDGKRPDDWKVVTVGDAFDITGGGTPSRKRPDYWEDGTINWYSPTDLTKSGLTFIDRSKDRINELGLKKSSARLFPANSVMLTSRATIGAVAVNTKEACTNQGFITCLPNERVPLFFLYQWVKGNVPEFIRHASGATFKEISKTVFKGLPFEMPLTDVVNSFEQIVSPVMRKIQNLETQKSNLRAQRDLLLPRLVSGSINVSDTERTLEAAAE